MNLKVAAEFQRYTLCKRATPISWKQEGAQNSEKLQSYVGYLWPRRSA